jgi:hypothetical protein
MPSAPAPGVTRGSINRPWIDYGSIRLNHPPSWSGDPVTAVNHGGMCMHDRPEEISAPAPRNGVDLMRDALQRLQEHEGETPLVAEMRAYVRVASGSARPARRQ